MVKKYIENIDRKKFAYTLFSICAILFCVAFLLGPSSITGFTTLNNETDIIIKEDTSKGINLKEIFTIASGFSSKNSEHITIEINDAHIAILTPEKDFTGKETITLEALDQHGNVIQKKEFLVKVTPINDRPKLIKNIEDIEFKVGQKANMILNLNQIFSDDGNLTFNVSGNNLIDITIDDGKVTFIASSVASEQIIFTASDDSYIIQSNPVQIKAVKKSTIPTGNIFKNTRGYRQPKKQKTKSAKIVKETVQEDIPESNLKTEESKPDTL